MKKLLIPFFITLCVMLTFLVAAAHPGKPDNASDTAEFKGLIDRYWSAWSSLDTDTVAPYYAKDADLVFFDVAPLKYQGWNAYKTGAQKTLLAKTARLKVTSRDDLKVTRHGDFAWTAGTFHLIITPKEGDPTETDIRHTAIWEKRSGKWLIVHEHVSVPMAE